MKSQIFKTAWSIARINKVSFSAALTLAWKAYKNEVKIVVTESWNKIKRIAFNKNGTQNGTIEAVINATRSVVNNEGAKWDYKFGTYNGD